MPTCDAIIVVAESIGDLGVGHKMDSAMIAQAAVAAGVPVYVLADETKILPRRLPAGARGRPPLLRGLGCSLGIRVWNRYFEVMPMAYVTSIVTEQSVFSPGELDEPAVAIDAQAECAVYRS